MNSNYALRMDAIAERITAVRELVVLQREALDAEDADVVEVISDLINAIYTAYPNLCPVDGECDGRCNHALSMLFAVAVHCLAEKEDKK